MRLGIIADSHDNIPHVIKAVNIFNIENVEYIIHAGDYVAPFTMKELLKADASLIGIFGNNDGEKRGLKNLCKDIYESPYSLDLGGKKVTIIHDIESLRSELKESSDIIIFGHTHKSKIKKGIPFFLNPGECGGWLNGTSSVALLDTNKLEADIIEI